MSPVNDKALDMAILPDSARFALFLQKLPKLDRGQPIWPILRTWRY